MASETRSDGRRVCVIGIDGATFDLIKPWAAEGKLPNFKKLFAEGTYADLRSVPSCRSAAAWTSFITGTNPGKHGIYEFYDYLPERNEVKFINSSIRDGDSIWKRASEAGKTVAVVNVPMTYPAEKVKGVLVGGIDTPGVESAGFTYPREFAETLEKRYGKYIIEPGLTGFIVGGKVEQAAARLEEETLQKADLSKALMSTLAWDFFMVVFRSVDAAQHCFWKYMDSSHPQFNQEDHEKFGDVILDTYRKIDEFLGETLEDIGDDGYVMLMSDHGFGRKHPASNQVNMWLRKNGLLKFKSDSESGRNKSSVSDVLVRALGVIYKIVIGATPRKFKEALARTFPALRNKVTSRLVFSDVDWSATRAYSESVFPTIRINVKGREKNGIVEPGGEFEELVEKIRADLLESCRDSVTGEKIVSQALRKEEIYHGKYVFKAPDLLIKWREDCLISGILLDDEPSRSGAKDERRASAYKSFITGEDPDVISGDHHSNGIFMLHGPGVKKGLDLGRCELLDLTPTIYTLLGLALSDDFDGRPRLDCFADAAALFSNRKPEVQSDAR